MKDENEHNQFNERPDDFGLPGDYFKKSAGSIFNKIEWEEEHKAFVNLLHLKNKPGFIVPEHYFSKKERELELIHYPKLSSLRNRHGFSVPENYFENVRLALPGIILENGEHELQSYEKLTSLKKQNSFGVDPAYFANNASDLKTLLEKNKQAKIISLFSRRLGYAVAALLIAALGIWTYNYYFIPVELKDCGTIACIDKQDLVKTKNLETMEDEDLYRLVDPSALEKKLNKVHNENTSKKDRDDSLNDISGEDLLDEI